MNLEGIKVGDEVKRMLGGHKGVPMQLIVTGMSNDLIYCGTADGKVNGWQFRIDNGAEVDEDLGWDGINTTGSIITEITSRKSETDFSTKQK